jgi:hypothetical protein
MRCDKIRPWMTNCEAAAYDQRSRATVGLHRRDAAILRTGLLTSSVARASAAIATVLRGWRSSRRAALGLSLTEIATALAIARQSPTGEGLGRLNVLGRTGRPAITELQALRGS